MSDDIIYSDLTLIDIEKNEGILEKPAVYADSSLSVWYNNVREKHLSELTDGDISRFLRQELYLEYIVPEAIKRLWKNPVIGELFNGEVFTMLYKLNTEFWVKNSNLVGLLLKVVNEVKLGKLVPVDFEWAYEGEKQEFYSKISLLDEKLRQL